MDRRKSLKAIALGTVSTGVLVDACKLADKKKDEKAAEPVAEGGGNLDRTPEEIAQYKRIMEKPFFNAHEMATITVLADIIIPKDDISGSASEAGVPAFIDFIVKDMPAHQVPMQGGIQWVDFQCKQRFGKAFVDCTQQQQLEMVDDIAYPKKAKPGMGPGVAFFSRMRNLTASGFYTTEMGLKDIGYVGNRPNQWNGVPDEVLKQYNLAYTEKELKECVSFDKPTTTT
jgi:gluconate 2-dehydrogenase gamma chain